LVIWHPARFLTLYANASELLVALGDSVHVGLVIAKSGRSGDGSEPQLHFEILQVGLKKGPVAIDPLQQLQSASAKDK
jgi:murein DD-endopeptidase MepM/ murein hydrolase activator NlpD